MVKASPQSIYYDILEHEVRFARAVAMKVMRPKPFSVWEVLIPIVFILGYMRSRNNRELFVQNFVFTKKAALEAVRDMHAKDLTLAQVRQRLEDQTRQLITVENDVYSEPIRQAQLNEMNLLMSHYNLLFTATKGNYTARVVSAYRNKAAYLNFILQLNAVEKAVAQAAVETLGTQADTALLTRIETSAAALRRQHAQDHFG